MYRAFQHGEGRLRHVGAHGRNGRNTGKADRAVTNQWRKELTRIGHGTQIPMGGPWPRSLPREEQYSPGAVGRLLHTPHISALDISADPGWRNNRSDGRLFSTGRYSRFCMETRHIATDEGVGAVIAPAGSPLRAVRADPADAG